MFKYLPGKSAPLAVILAASFSLTLAGKAWCTEATPATAQPETLINDQLPLPDNYYNQALKSSVLLKGHATTSSGSTLQSIIMAPPQESVLPLATPATRAILPPPQSPSIANPSANIPETTSLPNTAGAPTTTDIVILRINDLMDSAFKQNPELQQCLATIDKYKNWKFRMGERAKDMLNYACLFKGVAPSSEAGDVVLDEKNKMKSLAAARYMKQKLSDAIELKVTTQLLELAGGLGKTDAAMAKLQSDRAALALQDLSGKEETDKMVSLLQSLSGTALDAADAIYKHQWTIADSKRKLETVVATAAKADPIIAEVTDDVHHYNQHTDAVLGAHRAARVALSVASMTPDFIGPAAQAVLFGYITVTGGTEQEKLLSELYIDKRLASRANLLSEQAHLALYNYQVGMLTNNRVLAVCSKKVLAKMIGSDPLQKVLNDTAPAPATPQTTAVGQSTSAVVAQ